VPLDLENVEEIFSLASSSDDPELMQNATLAIAAMLDYCETTTKRESWTFSIFDSPDSAPPSWKPMSGGGTMNGRLFKNFEGSLYDFYLLILTGGQGVLPAGRRDTIITFNYDVLVEKALRNLGVPFDYGFVKYKPYIDDSFVLRQRNKVGGTGP
jgi:hypothetical protein